MKQSVKVVFGTESGNAEMVADDIVEALQQSEIAVDLEEMSDVDIDSLGTVDNLILVCSTYEEGELPASAQPLHDEILQAKPDLSDMNLYAFGLGDSSYDQFCGGIDTMVDLFGAHGAKLNGTTVKHDALSGESSSEMGVEWVEGLIASGALTVDDAPAAELMSEEGHKDDAAHHDFDGVPAPGVCPVAHEVKEDHGDGRDDSEHEIHGTYTTSVGDVEGELFRWNDKEFQRNPYPFYAKARESSPVHYAGDQTYVVTRYSDVMKHFKSPVMSIRAPERIEHNPFESAFNETVLSLDPPDHAKSRRLFSRWFTPKLIKKWVEYTEEAMDKIIDDYIPGTELDGHFDLGVAPTHITMARILDLDPGEAEPLFWALWDGMLIQATDPKPGTWDKSAEAVNYMFKRTEDLLLEKMENPGEGLADEFISRYKSGEITWNAVVQNTVNFYMSGAPNPAYLIGSALEVFANHPEVMEAFRTQPESRAKIIDEVARLNPVELLLTRFPTEDIQIGGVDIPAESCIKFPIGAVNRDPEIFADPDKFDFQRDNGASRHLTFGLGTHACAGQAIARAETEVILGRVAQAFEKIELTGNPVRVITDRLVAYKSQPMAMS